MRKFILGLDEGTTSARSVLYNVDKNEIVDIEGLPFKQYYPQNGWVEQDANEIFKKILKTSKDVLARNGVEKGELLGIGITNQRETIVAWDRETGEPVYHAIVWQCRRTSKMIEKLSAKTKKLIQEKTGLIANPYFSASKMKWILENVPQARVLAKREKLCFGTIDCFLNFKLTGNFYTDTTNASRTMLMNIKTLSWDDELLKIFDIPKHSLPKILSSNANFGTAKKLLNAPVCAIIGDQMSSMIGQGAIQKGSAKITYGTGGFVLSNIGDQTKRVSNLLLTVAYTIDNKTEYAIEGSIYSACSCLNWIKDKLSLFEDYSEISHTAENLENNGGVYFVPAFTGLGAPYWLDNVRGSIVGLTFDTKKDHIIRAAMESMVYNTKDIFDELKVNGQKFKFVSVDGGGSKNPFVLQFLSDMLNLPVLKSKYSESTVLGAIFMAMISLKLIKIEDIKSLTESHQIYHPKINKKERDKLFDGWKEAIKKV